MYLIHGVKGAINMSHQLHWTMDHVMEPADSVVQELFTTSAIRRYRIQDNRQPEPPNGIRTKRMQGRRKDLGWGGAYQLMKPTR